MTNRTVIVAKEYGQKTWMSYPLPGGRCVAVIPRESFERACAAANQKLQQAVKDIRRQTKASFQGDIYGL